MNDFKTEGGFRCNLSSVKGNHNLEKLRVTAIQELEKALLLQPEVTFDPIIAWFRHTIQIKIQGYIWSEQLGDHVMSHPASWWQAFKREVLPWWIRRYFPVREKTIVVSVKALYPGWKPFVEPCTFNFNETELE